MTDRLRLFLLGLLTLFLELALIRYLAGAVWNLGYFPNLVLIAVFVGMGVGFVLHHRLPAAARRHTPLLAAGLLLALVLLVLVLHPSVPGFGRWAGDVGGDLYFTEVPAGERADPSPWLFALWFGLVVAVFALISQRTAEVFARLPPLQAYSFDIAGACTGIAAFMLASWLTVPAWAWFLALVPLFLVAMEARLAAAPLLAAVFAVAAGDAAAQGDEVTWSPYQRVEYATSDEDPHRVWVNGVPHQRMFDRRELDGTFYRLPYRGPQAAPTGHVLILGAGTGNDVQAALDAGATSVVAVEIDPVIAALGRARHPARPYDDPRVELIVDDGRAVLARFRRAGAPRFRRVVFALTDSLVKVSAVTQLRLENYLFTVEAAGDAYAVLSDEPGAEVVLYNFYRRPWLREKLLTMLAAATGRRPRVAFERGDFSMIAVGPSDPPAGAAPVAAPAGAVEVPTDDWPFLYLRERAIPAQYASAMAALGLLVVLLLAALHLRPGARPAALSDRAGLLTKLAFLGMGVAFMLLETKGVVQFSLLFGTTWVNASLVFLAVLLLVLAANFCAARLPDRPRTLAVVGALLLLSCAAPLVVPLSSLAPIPDAATRFLAAAALTFAPVGLANLLFGLAFRDQAVPEHLFGWNILGATFGAVIEYAGMAAGYRTLAWVVLGAYSLVLVCLFLAGRQPTSARAGSIREALAAGTTAPATQNTTASTTPAAGSAHGNAK